MPRVRVGQQLDEVVLQAMKKQNLHPRKSDIIAVASKVVSTCENQLVQLDQVRVTSAARQISRKWALDQRLATIVLEEADDILGGVPGFLLTIKDGILTANAGIDRKNCPPGTAILWPQNPDASAASLRKWLERKYRVRLGVIVVDSRVTALRLGTVGLAIGLSGFVPVSDFRGVPDIYGRKVKVTQTNAADDLASFAHLLMGETSERIGVVVIKNAPIHLHSQANSSGTRLKAKDCLITNWIRAVSSKAL